MATTVSTGRTTIHRTAGATATSAARDGRGPSGRRRAAIAAVTAFASLPPVVWAPGPRGLAAAPGREAFPQLTGREREVLRLVARGLDNRRIARELVLSDKTVRNHVSSLMTKLGVADRVEAGERARNAGWGEPGPATAPAPSARRASRGPVSDGRRRAAAG